MHTGIRKDFKRRARMLETEYFQSYGLNSSLKKIFSSIMHCTIDFLPKDLMGVCSGRYDPKERTIYILPALYIDRFYDLLIHEMIHYYEVKANSFTDVHMTEYLTMILYHKLKERIPKLTELINAEFSSLGSTHSYFFLLMSIDLDLRRERPLGSTFGYYREEPWRIYADGIRRG